MQENGDPPILATLVFPVQGNGITLATKTSGPGAGRLNGYGGGVEPGETLDGCALREFYEETGGAYISEIVVASGVFRYRGMVRAMNYRDGGGFSVCDIFVYTTLAWKGEIRSTSEMQNPRVYKARDIPRLNMLPGDKYWLPQFLSGYHMYAEVTYSPGQRELLGEVRVSYRPIEVAGEMAAF